MSYCTGGPDEYLCKPSANIEGTVCLIMNHKNFSRDGTPKHNTRSLKEAEQPKRSLKKHVKEA